MNVALASKLPKKNKVFTVKKTAHKVGILTGLVKEYSELYLRFNNKDYIDRVADILKLAQDKASIKTAAKKGRKYERRAL